MRARARVMMMRNTTILMIDVTYSNQAKALFGSRKMAKQAAQKRVTWQEVRSV